MKCPKRGTDGLCSGLGQQDRLVGRQAQVWVCILFKSTSVEPEWVFCSPRSGHTQQILASDEFFSYKQGPENLKSSKKALIASSKSQGLMLLVKGFLSAYHFPLWPVPMFM
jgi:hypothetical protein